MQESKLCHSPHTLQPDNYFWTATKAQWFRARADMMRWTEEVELLDEKWRRLIRGLDEMSALWKSMSQTPPTKQCKYIGDVQTNYSLIFPKDGLYGYYAYAARK